MATVDVVDETYLDVDRAVVAAVLADPAAWRRWWPDLLLRVVLDRGVDGIRWEVGGAWTGTAEVWLEPWDGATILHHYQRLEPVGGPLDLSVPRYARRAARWRATRARAWKRQVWELKDHLEASDPAR